jgi:hypothetical protein
MKVRDFDQLLGSTFFDDGFVRDPKTAMQA